MLNRTFAGFHGLFIGGNEAVYCRKTHKNQSLDCSKGGAGHDHLSMLFRIFAVYIKLGLTMNRLLHMTLVLGKVLSRNASHIAFAALIGLVAIPIIKDRYDQYEKQAAKEAAARLKVEIGLQASIAGSMLWSAYKSCSRIGIADVNACAGYSGILLQERAAPAIAKLAIEQQGTYNVKCISTFDKDYCSNLLNRAFQLSQFAPAEPSSGQ